MIRFALAQSADPRSYVEAGAQAAKDALSIQRAVDQSSPNYGQLNLAGAELASLDAVSAAKNKAALEVAEMNADISRSKADEELNLKENQNRVLRTQRMAGKLALAAEMFADASRKETEQKPPTPIDYSKLRKAIEEGNDPAQIDELIKQMEIRLQEIEGNKIPVSNNLPMNPSSKNSTQQLAMSPAGSFSNDANRYALTQTIKYAEGTRGPNSYKIMYGHTRNNPRLLSDFSAHPNNPIPTPWGTSSGAAGAYQFMPKTWDMVKANNPSIKDFSPESQELAADYLIRKKGVDPYAAITSYDQFGNVMTKLSPTWASLPYQGGGSYYDQPSKTQEELYKVYQQALQEFSSIR